MIPEELVSVQDEQIMSNNTTPADVEEAVFTLCLPQTTS
jgi:hypothetical protein